MAEKPTAKDVKTAQELDEVLKAVEIDAQSAAVAMSQMASALKGSSQATDYQARAMRALIKPRQQRRDGRANLPPQRSN